MKLITYLEGLVLLEEAVPLVALLVVGLEVEMSSTNLMGTVWTQMGVKRALFTPICVYMGTVWTQIGVKREFFYSYLCPNGGEKGTKAH